MKRLGLCERIDGTRMKDAVRAVKTGASTDGSGWNPNRRRSGFTLVELMAAIVLAALLTTGLIGVLRGMIQQRKLLPEQHSAEGWKTQVQDRLLREFSNARRMKLTRQRLELLGYGSRDGTSGTATHRPAQVTYEVDVIGGKYWLVRTEQLIGSKQAATRELVAHGIKDIRAMRLEDDEQPEEIIDDDAQQFFAVPSKLRCVLVDADDRPVIECVYLQPRSAR